MTRLFDLDFQLLHDSVLTAISVFTLFLIASNKLFNPVTKFLKKREDRIADDLEHAQESRLQAEDLKADYDAKLKNINIEAEEILNEARKKAQTNGMKITAEAKADAVRIIERAKAEANLEKQKAADEMKKEMVSIASIMAGKVVSASIDTTVQESLIEDTLKEMGESTWLS